MSNDGLSKLLRVLLGRRDDVECKTVLEWLPVWRAACRDYGRYGPYVAAIAAAVAADRMAWSVFCGNQGAVQAAFPRASSGGLGRAAAFCANESGRKVTAIETSILESDGALRLAGAKSWCLADLDDLDLYVLARAPRGPASGPGSLVVVGVASTDPGVEMGEMRMQSVVPELRHCRVRFAEVQLHVEQVLPGDGYANYARPFRLLEDVFVTGCTLAFLLGRGHAGGWPMRWRQRCVAAIVNLGTCAARAPDDLSTELLTAGALSIAGNVVEEADRLWADSGFPGAEGWVRDKSILTLGKEARRQRARVAWERLGWTNVAT